MFKQLSFKNLLNRFDTAPVKQELSYEIVEVQTREQAQDVFAACDESNIASWRLIQTGNQEAGSLGSGASGQLFLQFEEEKGIFVCMLLFLKNMHQREQTY